MAMIVTIASHSLSSQNQYLIGNRSPSTINTNTAIRFSSIHRNCDSTTHFFTYHHGYRQSAHVVFIPGESAGAVVRGRLSRDARTKVQGQGWDDGAIHGPPAEIHRAGEGKRGGRVRSLRICELRRHYSSTIFLFFRCLVSTAAHRIAFARPSSSSSNPPSPIDVAFSCRRRSGRPRMAS